MKVHDARWVADEMTAASWHVSLVVDSLIDDADAATRAGDWETAVESSLRAIMEIVRVRQILGGFPAAVDDPAGTLVAVAAATDPLVEVLDSLHPPNAGPDDAARALSAAVAASVALRDDIPFDIPVTRTPEGLFPGMRLARECETVRSLIGLVPFRPAFDT